MNFRWVQISDVHFSHTDFQTKRMRSRLFDLLNTIKSKGSIDCLFITGDITDKSSTYDEATKQFVEGLVNTLEIKDRTKVFIIPGNHDVDRNIPLGRPMLLKGLFSNYKNYNSLNKEINDLREGLIKAQEKFFEFYKEIKECEYPQSKVHFVTQVNDKMNVINLNTSWLCGFDGEDENLFLGIENLFDILEENKKELMEAKLNIAIGHHNIDCYNDEEKSELLNLFRDYNIDFYLSGHIHDSSAVYEPKCNTHLIVCNQMKADEKEYYGGFSVGNISDKDCHIEFYKWSGNGDWAVDTNVGTILRNGIYNLEHGRILPENTDKDCLIIHKTMNTPPNENKIAEDLNLNLIFCDVKTYPYTNLNISSQEEWNIQKKETEAFYNTIKDRISGRRVYISALSQIPLLIYLGQLIGNDSEIIISQFDEGESKWVLYEDNAKIGHLELINFNRKEDNKSKKLIITISVSAEINFEDVKESIEVAECDILELSIKDPALRKILHTNQVEEIKKDFYKITNSYVGEYDEIHLFYAGPAGLGIEVGRCIRKNMWPKVTLYNYRRNNRPSYQQVFCINE